MQLFSNLFIINGFTLQSGHCMSKSMECRPRLGRLLVGWSCLQNYWRFAILRFLIVMDVFKHRRTILKSETDDISMNNVAPLHSSNSNTAHHHVDPPRRPRPRESIALFDVIQRSGTFLISYK